VTEQYFFPGKVRVAGRRSNSWCPRNPRGVPEQSWALHGDRHRRRPGTDRSRRPDFTGPPDDDDMSVARRRAVVAVGHPQRRPTKRHRPSWTSSHPIRIRSHVLTRLRHGRGSSRGVPGVAADAGSGGGNRKATHHGARRRASTRRGQRSSPARPPASIEKRTVPARLRTLNQLLEDGLITPSRVQ